MSDSVARLISLVLWLAIPTVVVVVEYAAAYSLHRLLAPIRGKPGTRILGIIQVGIFWGAVAQTLGVINAYRLVILGGATSGGVVVTLVLYFASQIIIGAVIVWAVKRLYVIMRTRVPDEPGRPDDR